MSALRWILASATVLVMVGFIALLGFADSFRRSFGASENGPLLALLPVTAILVFLAGLIFPRQRALLHVAATLALALVVCAVWVLQESVFVGVTGLLYSALYLVWYWHAAWTRATASTLGL
jgi:hypothetical protein